MRSFESAARLGSFQKAAEELFVTPSAVSHQVRSLESFLDLELFQREGRRVLLTQAGEHYLAAVQLALDGIESATRSLLSASHLSSVNVASVAVFLTRWLVPRLADFQSKYPDIELRLSTLDRKCDFEYSDINLAIYFSEDEWQGTTSHFMRNSDIVPVCTPELAKSLSSLDDLKKQTLIHVDVPTRKREWHEYFDQQGLGWSFAQKNLTISTTSLALIGAMEGLGVVLSDRHLIEREIKYGQLAIPFEDKTLESKRKFYLAYSDKRPPTPDMQAFCDWLFASLAEDIDFI